MANCGIAKLVENTCPMSMCTDLILCVNILFKLLVPI